MSRRSCGNLCAQIALALVACLPFVVPFDAVRNIDAQGLLLIVAGVFAWAAIACNWKVWISRYDRRILALLAIFMVCCLGSTVFSPHAGYNLLGTPYMRLGALGLMACVGCGVIMRHIKAAVWSTYFYLEMVAIGVLSIPYSLIRLQTINRLPGLLAQPVLTAVFLGCGIVVGLYLLQIRPKQHRFIIISQVLLTALLLLTQTRLIIVAVGLVCLAWQYHQRRKPTWHWFGYIMLVLLIIGGLHAAHNNRLVNISYARQSVDYRADLQLSALHAAEHRPVLGYGPGNLADALDCRHLTATALRQSCHQGYFFNSSHNIFIDRVLAVGWLGGLSYAAIVVLALYRGLRAKPEIRIIAYAALLITVYYLTNVTSVTLELLYWILLLRCLVASRAGA